MTSFLRASGKSRMVLLLAASAIAAPALRITQAEIPPLRAQPRGRLEPLPKPPKTLPQRGRQRGWISMRGVVWIAAILACVALWSAVLGWFTGRLELARAEGRAEVQALWNAAAAAADTAQREEEARRTRAQQEAQDANARALALLAADAASSRHAAGRLQQRVDTLESAARRQACGSAAPAGDGQAAGDPIGVLAELQRRADERAGVLAAYADRARAAGALCERLYDALEVTR